MDVGTNWGESAVSLAQNPRNKIITYDIRKIWELPFLDNYSNLEFKLMDISKENDNIIKSAKIIFLDIAHDGMQEWSFTDRLLSIGYKGYLICDDIFAPFYPMMKPWWDSINIEKYDLTEIGHTWGTGLVNYYRNNDVKIIR